MKKKCLILIILILNLNFGLAQTKFEIDTLLDIIAETENSKEIIKIRQARKIITFGDKSLPILADFFTDSTLTKVYSECQERKLTKGDLAIILADGIQKMPYFRITGIQNCLLIHCDNNPNWIEFYLSTIKQNGYDKFEQKYRDWLTWIKLSEKDKRKVERKNKKYYKSQQRNNKKRQKIPAGNNGYNSLLHSSSIKITNFK